MEYFKEFVETFIDFEVPFMLLMQNAFIETEREIVLFALTINEDKKEIWFREKREEGEEPVETKFTYSILKVVDETFIFTLEDGTEITFCFFYL